MISEARFRNTLQNEKVSKWKELKEKHDMEEMRVLFANEEKYLKKMQKIAKSTADLHEKIKEKKTVRAEKLNQNRAHEEDQVEAKLKSIMAKFKQAESNVEQIRVSQIMLELLMIANREKKSMRCN